MDKLAVSQKSGCLICYNNENNTNLTIVNSEKILNTCGTYLDNSIITESFENDKSVSCCNYCYESVVELIILEKQVEKLRKEITELRSLFLKNVLERRNHFKKDNQDIFNIIFTPSVDKCVTVDESSGRLLTVVSKNLIVQKAINELRSEVLPPNSPGTTEIVDSVSDVGLNANDYENIIQSEGCSKVVQVSYKKTVSKIIGSVNEQIKPHHSISEKTTQECQQTIKTSMADLLKCLKMPIIQLERLPACKSRKPTLVADKISNSCDLEITDPENCCNLSMGNSYPSSKNTYPPEPAGLPANQENSVFIYTQSLNAPVIAAEEVLKCENDTEENIPNTCSICGQDFFQLCDLEDHEKLHYNGNQYTSSICDKSFLDPSVLESHASFHILNQPFRSSFSSESVRAGTGSLSEPEVLNNGDKQFICSVCTKSYSSTLSLKRHKMLHSQNRPFKCSFCPKSFKTSDYLRNHETVHTGERPYKCSRCPKSFLSSRDLKNHETIHTGDTPFKCSICSKSFRNASNLKGHEKIHTEIPGQKFEDMYKCSFCQKSLCNLQSLKNHEAAHSGVRRARPYKCSTCSKSFRFPSDLRRHESFHTGEKPFKCSSCEKTFKLQHHLKKHERIHGNPTEEFILT